MEKGGKDDWPTRSEYEGDFSDSESDVSIDSSNLMYPVLNMSPAHSQNIALWSFINHHTLAVFVPTSQDALLRIVEYAEEHLGYNRDRHKLMILDPGQQVPVHIKSVYSVKPGSVVMVLPSSSIYVDVEISQLKASFTLSVELTSTVLKIKSQVRKLKGVPMDRQEILYRDRALENNRRLLEYNLTNRQTLYVLIQAHFDLLINVETFWGKTYRLYVDPCSTGKDIFYTVFSRTFSHAGPDDPGLHELFIPLHVLVLMYRNKLVNGDICLAYLNICSNDTLRMTTVGHQSNLNLQPVTVVTESGTLYHLTISHYDRWSVLAFMLHGLTNVPVDLIRLYRNKQTLDFSATVGLITSGTVVVMNIVMTKMDEDLIYGIPVRVSLGNGIIENVKISPSKRIRSVKHKLERIGVPNAMLYDLVVSGNKKLVNTTRLDKAMHDVRAPLELKLEKFPVFVHTPDSVIYKTYIHVNQSIGEFRLKIQEKSGLLMADCRIIIAGEELDDSNSVKLYNAGVSSCTSLFIQRPKDCDSFYILGSTWFSKLKIPAASDVTDIKNAVWQTKKMPESSINGVLTFLYWFYLPRLAVRNPVKSRRQDMKRLPITTQPLTLAREGDDSQEITGNDDKQTFSYFIPSTKGDDAKTWPIVKNYVQPNIQPNFLPSQFLDLPDDRLGDLVQGHTMPVDIIKSKYPSMTTKSNPTPWMGHLQRRHKENRLILSDIQRPPDFIFNKKQQMKSHTVKKNKPDKLPEIKQSSYNPKLSKKFHSSELRASLPLRNAFTRPQMVYRGAESQR